MKKILNLIMMILLVFCLQHPASANDVHLIDYVNDSNAIATSEAMLNDIQAETEALELNNFNLIQKVQTHLSNKREELTLLEKIQTETRELFVAKPICFRIDKHEPINARRLQ